MPVQTQTKRVLTDKLEVDALAYLNELSAARRHPLILVQRKPFQSVMEELGAKGISVPDVFEPYQLQYPLYIGATTPHAKSEVPHWHPDQTEVYVIIDGKAEM